MIAYKVHNTLLITIVFIVLILIIGIYLVQDKLEKYE